MSARRPPGSNAARLLVGPRLDLGHERGGFIGVRRRIGAHSPVGLQGRILELQGFAVSSRASESHREVVSRLGRVEGVATDLGMPDGLLKMQDSLTDVA